MGYEQTLFTMLPDVFQAEDEQGHLEAYCQLLGRGWDSVQALLDKVGRLPFFEEEEWSREFAKAMNFDALNDLLTFEDLQKVLPWLVRLYKIKGLGLAIILFARLIFKASSVEIVDLSPYVFRTWIENQTPPSKTYKEGEVVFAFHGAGIYFNKSYKIVIYLDQSTDYGYAAYIQSKIQAFESILQYFLPIFAVVTYELVPLWNVDDYRAARPITDTSLAHS